MRFNRAENLGCPRRLLKLGSYFTRSRTDLPAVMLGVVNGQYLYLRMDKLARTPPFIKFLSLSEPQLEKNTKVVLQPDLSSFVLAHSGRYIAYAQQGQSTVAGNTHIVPQEHVWIRSLPAGEPKEMFSLETGVERRTYLTLIGWMGEYSL